MKPLGPNGLSFHSNRQGVYEPLSVVRKLIEDLTSNNPNIREKSIRSLGNMGRSAQTAIPELVNLLNDKNEDWYIRAIAAWSLGYIGGEEVVSPLSETLKDNNEYIRWAAVEALGRGADSAEKRISALVIALSDSSRYVRMEATSSLTKIESIKQRICNI